MAIITFSCCILKLKEVHTGSNPLGINVFLNILQKWNYDQDPFSALEYEVCSAAISIY